MPFPIEIPAAANPQIAAEVAARWNSLTKPPGSLGRLESLVEQLAQAAGTARPSATRKAIAVFCGDHGITAEGVSAYPKEVTRQMVLNFLAGGAAITVLCRRFQIVPYIVDAGVDADPTEGAINLRIARGTANFARGPAMSISQAEQALHNGIRFANTLRPVCDLAATGEMGIGNTTSASALLCAYRQISPEQAAGPGTGLDAPGVQHKVHVLRDALRLHGRIADPVEVLATFGGFEIATMAGFLLGAASARLPVVVDGFISSVAALAAHAINPAVLPFLFFSHVSAEPAHQRLLAELHARPIFDLDMRLGEGSGAALAMPVFDAAIALYDNMATFAEARVTNRE